MAKWVNKKIFKKNILLNTNSGRINVAEVSGSRNWDTQALSFLSGMSELDMSKNGRGVVKVQDKVNDLIYNVGYKYIVPKKRNTENPNNLLFSNSYSCEGCYYIDVVVSFDTNVSDRNYSIRFDISCDGRFVEQVEHIILVMAQGNLRYKTLKRIRLYAPTLGRHTFAFSNPRISGAIQIENVRMESISYFVPDLDGGVNLKTNIIIGENIKIVE